MTLLKLQQDMFSAMKEGDYISKEVLSSAIAAIKKMAIDKKCKDDIPESLVDEVLRKEYKTLKEQIDNCPADNCTPYPSKKVVAPVYINFCSSSVITLYTVIIFNSVSFSNTTAKTISSWNTSCVSIFGVTVGVILLFFGCSSGASTKALAPKINAIKTNVITTDTL